MKIIKNGELVRCPDNPEYRNPRYPEAAFCKRHYELLHKLLPRNWSKIDDHHLFPPAPDDAA